MKKLYLLFISFLCMANANAMAICGIDLDANLGFSYGTVSRLVGVFAIGTGCAGAVDATVTPINEMCDVVYVGGRYATGKRWVDCSDDSCFADGGGAFCSCRRTHVLKNDVLTESPGPWVFIGFPPNCRNACVDAIRTNSNGYRNPIMLLPAE